jgi:translocation and assembly module TamB
MNLKKILRLLKWISLGFLAVFMITLAAVNIPAFQKKLTRIINHALASKGIPVKVQQVSLLITGKISLDGLEISGPAHDTIVFVKNLRVAVNPLKLLVKKVSVSSLSLKHATVILKPDDITGKLNIAAVFKKTGPGAVPVKKPGKKKSWVIRSGQISLEDVQFLMHTREGGLSMAFHVDRFRTSSIRLFLAERNLETGNIVLKNTTGKIVLKKSSSPDTTTTAKAPWSFYAAGILLDNDSVILDMPLKQFLIKLNTGEISARSNRIDLKQDHFEMENLLLNGITMRVLGGKTSEKQPKSVNPDSSAFLSEDMAMILKKARIRNSRLAFGLYPGSLQGEASPVMQLEKISADIKNARLSKANAGIRISNLSFLWNELTDLRDADIDFISEDKTGTNLDIRAKTKNSSLSAILNTPVLLDELLSAHRLPENFGITLEKTKVSVNELMSLMKKSKISLSGKKHQYITIQGNFEGKGKVIDVNNLVLQLPGKSELTIDGSLKPGKRLTETRADLDYHTSEIGPEQLKLILAITGKDLGIPDLGTFHINGRINGSAVAPHISLLFSGDAGTLSANAGLDLLTRHYHVVAHVERADLARITNNKDLNRLAFSVSVDGENFGARSISADMDLFVDSLQFKNYTYHDLILGAKAGRDSVSCIFSSEDRYATFRLEAKAGFRDSVITGTSTGNFHINPGILSLYKDTFDLSGAWKAELSFAPRSLHAGLNLKNITWQKNQQQDQLNEFKIGLNTSDSLTTIEVSSDFMEANLNAESSGMTLLKLPGLLLKKFKSSLQNGYSGSIAETMTILPFQASARISYHPFMGLIIPDSLLYFDQADMKLTNKGHNNQISGDVNLANIQAYNLGLHQVRLQISSTTGSSKLVFHSDSTFITKAHLGALDIEVELAEKKNGATVQLLDRKAEKLFFIDIENTRYDDSLVFASPTGEWTLNGIVWELRDPRFLVRHLQEKDLQARLHLAHGPAYIDLTGKKSGQLTLQLNQVLLEWLINPDFISQHPTGTLTGTLSYAPGKTNDLSFDIGLEELSIADLSLQSFHSTGNLKNDTLGNFGLNASAWIDTTSELTVMARSAKFPKPARDLRVSFSNIPLSLLEPFMKSSLSALHGSVTGDISYKLDNLGNKLNGKVDMNDLAFRITPLNAAFTVPDQSIPIRDNDILFEHLSILDSMNHPLLIDGNIHMANIRDITADLRLNSENLQVMNTTEKDNPGFYGGIFINSQIEMKGPVTDPEITAGLKVTKPTSIHYKYLQNIEISESEKLITFASLAEPRGIRPDKVMAPTQIKSKTLLNASIEIDPQVQLGFEITRGFDIKVQITGGGFLNLGMMPSGAFILNGKYEIGSGETSLKFTGWPRKDFEIIKGSYVRWDGTMDNPLLQIEATSEVRSSYINPVDNKSRPVVLLVTLTLENSLSELGVNFDITTGDQYMTSVLNSLSSEERMRQAINLLLFGSVNLPNMESSSDYLSQQINQFWESQLNQLTKDAFKNVEIKVGINTYTGTSETGGNKEQTSLNYAVKKNFMNDRVSLIVEGRVNNEVKANESQAYLDNLAVEYALDSARSKLLKVYSMQDYEDVFEGQVKSTGVGFIYRKNYARFRDMWIRKKKRNPEK